MTELEKNLGLYTSPDFGKLRSCNFPKLGDQRCQSGPDCLVQACLGTRDAEVS